MERKEFAFENEYVKIINPTMDQEKEIALILKECANEKSNNASAYHILNKLCIPKNDKYDFSKYSIEEFEKMMDEIHLYNGLQEIINAAALVANDITIHELQYIALGLKYQRVQLLMSIIQDETEGLNMLGSEIFRDKKEIEKIKELANEYKKNREIRKEIEKLTDGVK